MKKILLAVLAIPAVTLPLVLAYYMAGGIKPPRPVPEYAHEPPVSHPEEEPVAEEPVEEGEDDEVFEYDEEDAYGFEDVLIDGFPHGPAPIRVEEIEDVAFEVFEDGRVYFTVRNGHALYCYNDGHMTLEEYAEKYKQPGDPVPMVIERYEQYSGAYSVVEESLDTE